MIPNSIPYPIYSSIERKWWGVCQDKKWVIGKVLFILVSEIRKISILFLIILARNISYFGHFRYLRDMMSDE